MGIIASGSQTAVINTKHELTASTSSATFVFAVDTANLALGDELELYVDIACESGGTRRQYLYNVFAHQQADPAKVSVPVSAPYGYACHLKQTAGTGRAFPWFVASL